MNRWLVDTRAPGGGVTRRRARIVLAIAAAAAAPCVWACPVQDTLFQPADADGGDGGDGARAADDGACATVAQLAVVGAVFGPTIDDLSGDQSATGGSWYSYSSRTLPNSEPAIVTSDAGSLNPSEGAPFPPNGATRCVPPLAFDGAVLGYREFSGDGIPAWGAGFGMDLVSGRPDGGPVAVNACDAGAIFDTRPDAGAVGIPQPYDASAYTGFSFWGISLTGRDLKIEVHLDDSDTTPWGGTLCDPCRSSGACTGSKSAGDLDCPCSDNFYETITLVHGQWTQFAVRWNDTGFAANHWSNEGRLTFDPSHVYDIHFQDTISSGVTPAFDIAVADLQWLTN